MVRSTIADLVSVAKTYRFLPRSGNRKTNCGQSYTSENSCPISCPLRGSGCYAEYWNTARVWKTAGHDQPKALTLEQYCCAIKYLPAGSLFRHGVAGDFAVPGTSDLDKIEFFSIMRAAHAAKITLYGYTHCTQTVDTLSALKAARVDYGCIINASCERLDQAKRVQAAGCDAVLTAPEFTPELKASGCVLCPAIASKGEISCAKCRLCTRHRSTVVVFTPHGAGKQKIIKVVRRLNSEDSCNL